MSNKKITVAVHDGLFHADDVFAIAILKKIYPKLMVVRTRDKDKLKSADMRVDIGGRYNAKTFDFDHHQDGSPIRANGMEYASCGLIWKHFGKKIVKHDEEFIDLDKKIFEFIDAEDNGVECTNDKVKVFTVSNIIHAFNPTWDEKQNYDKGFAEAVKFATKILDRQLERVKSSYEGGKLVREALKKAEKHHVILPKAGLPSELIHENKKMLYTIFSGGTGDWVAKSVLLKTGGFKRRAYFPKKWAGLVDSELEKVSGIKGAKFCHKNLFIVATKTKEGAIAMVEKALKK